MKYLPKSFALVVALCLGLTLPVFGIDVGRTVKSAVFPGMGQLADGQKVKGFAFMAGEIALLSLTIDQFSRSRTYAFQTTVKRDEYQFGGDFEKLQAIQVDWRKYYENAEKARLRASLFLGLSVACWGLNLADAMLFPPLRQEDEMSTLQESLSKVSVGFRGSQGLLTFTTEF